MSLKAVKVASSDTDGFVKTVAFALLQCTTMDGNNNKWFCIERQHNPSTDEWRIFTEYGRLGPTGAWGKPLRDVRGPASESEVIAEYDSIIKDKLKGKKKKKEDGSTYQEKYVQVDVPSPTVGSANIRKSTGTAVSAGYQGSKTKHDFRDTFTKMDFQLPVKSLLSMLLAENIHQIEHVSSVSVTASGLETPLGPVTAGHIARARSVLDAIKDAMVKDAVGAGRLDLTSRSNRDLNNDYFSLIPHPFSRKITDDDMISEEGKLLAEYDLLDQMAATLQVADQDAGADVKVVPDLGLKMLTLADRALWADIERYYIKSRSTGHGLDNYKIKAIYEVESRKDRDRYRVLPGGPEYDLWHGTKNANVLSILMNGFVVPPVNAPHVTGRMFGNGVYGADRSTKSLGYATGVWNRNIRNHSPSTFLLLSRFSMGRVHQTKRSCSGVPSGFNSIFAEGGADLRNNEYIVPNVSQATITHLVELTP